jgi:hypothetical protein
MVRAILDGRKSQTRRVFVPPLPFAPDDDIAIELAVGSIVPRHSVGDRMWVRESWSGPYRMGDIPPRDWAPGLPIWYWADGNPEDGEWTRPKPSIHMPRWASRITLEVTGVKVERLQDISEGDARAEGADPVHMQPNGGTGNPSDAWLSYAAGFRAIWTSINGPGSWEANPLVVALTFQRLPQPTTSGESDD